VPPPTIAVAAPRTAAPVARAEAWLPTRALRNVLVVAGGVAVTVAVVVLWGFDGMDYYRTPLRTRGYHPMHRILRPSGSVGITLGVLGVLSMLSTLPYAVRKRWRLLARLGTMKGWLEVHIFFGIVGPVLITFHTSFKFNGLVSVAYWLMVAVWSSGFVGRYLYVRVPRTIRGAELTREQLDARLADLRARVAVAPLSRQALAELQVFEAAVLPPSGHAPALVDLFLGELRVRARLWLLRRHLVAAGVDMALLHDAISVAGERASLLRRLEHLQRTKRLFELWHVFHQPLVYAMFAIVAIHVAVALYLGYGGLGG
jgi:hypothetical protein